MSTPYYADDHVTIYLGDALEHPHRWACIPDSALVTDPPYGRGYVPNASRFGSTDPVAGDTDTAVRDAALAMWLGGGADRPGLVFGAWQVARPAAMVHLLVWDKGDSPGMGDLTIPWGHGFEEVYVLGAGFVGGRRSNVLRHQGLSSNDKRRDGHPTPKPLPLMLDLLGNVPPELVIVDPFMGSGTTLRAAKDLGRRAVGFELDERYAERAAKRMGQEVLDLFGANT